MESYRINSPHVVSEIFADEEAAIINLKTGNYYSLNKTGADIWSRIEEGNNFSEIIEFIKSNFNVDDSFDRSGVEQFVKRLKDEDLIIADISQTHGGEAFSDMQIAPDSPAGRKDYETPVIECYADMQELLLLDPIHEFEENNWLNKQS